MNQQDKSFMMTFTAVLGVLVLISVVFFLAARVVSVVSTPPPDDDRVLAVAERRIQPVGRVVTGDAHEAAAQSVAATPSSGDEVYQQVCTVCHAAGVAGAPVSGDNAAWAERFQTQGLDTLISSVIDGLNAMPPRGGNPNLSDEEIRSAVVHMLQAADVPVEDAVMADAAPVPDVADAAETEGLDMDRGKSVYDQACTVCHLAGVAGAPVSGDNTAWSERYQQGFNVLVSNVINGLNAMPPRAGHSNLSDADISNAVAYMLDAAGVDFAAAAPVAEPAAVAADPDPVADEVATPVATAEPPAPAPDSAVIEAQFEAIRLAVDAAERAGLAAERAALAAERAAVAAERAAEAATRVQPPAAPAVQEPPSPAPEPSPAESAEPPPAEQEPSGALPAATVAIQSEAFEVPGGLDLARGEQLYNTACIICHDAGVAGAPRLGDRDAWVPRIAGGWENLARHSLEGHEGMPAKGGRIDIPDADILAAVAYMVSQSR